MSEQNDKLRNRADAKDRPFLAIQCRDASTKECKEHGHDWRFKKADRYGCCIRCGCEVLT